MGWSTWGEKYKRFVCVRSRITVTIHTADAPITTGIMLSSDANATTSFYSKAWQYIEANRGQYATLTKGFNTPAITQSSFDACKFFSLDDVNDAQSLIGGGTSQVATQEAYYTIWGEGYGDAWNARGYVSIEYDVIFSDPEDIPAPISVAMPVHDRLCRCSACDEERKAFDQI